MATELSSRKSCLKQKAIVVDVTPEQRGRVDHLLCALRDQANMLDPLDKEILKFMEDDDEVDEQAMAAEVEKFSTLRSDIKTAIEALESVLNGPQTNSTTNEPSTSMVETTDATTIQPTSPASPGVNPTSVRVRLPKLEVKKFSGKIEEWQEFWDSYESAIHENENLSSVDKFNYLRGLITGQAKSAIAGFSLTSANYEAAIQLLRKRYGKETIIKRAHIQELLNVQPVYNARDGGRLRALCDKIETHHRGLEALGVDAGSYSDIVVPAILEKIPETVRLTITRDKKHDEWSVNDVLEALEKEVILREEFQPRGQNQNETDHGRKKRWKVPDHWECLPRK